MKIFDEILIFLANFFLGLLATLGDLVYDFICYLINQIVVGIGYIISPLFSLLEFTNLSEYINMMPSEAINILSLVGFGEAMGMICTALVIRFCLQLIPFVRLGS